MDRRTFLKTFGAAAAGAAALGAGASRRDPGLSTTATATAGSTTRDDAAINARIAQTAKGKLPTRVLGKMGVEVGVLGLGAAWFKETSDKESFDFLNRVIDSGINYIDTASTYGEGKSEIQLGKVMKSRRAEVFLATKILKRKYSQTQREFEISLSRLQTEYVDLLQIHAVNRKEELEQIFARDGALRTALEAQQNGLTRFVGITGHTRPEVIAEALRRHKFDSLLIPLGLADTYINDFNPVIPVAQEQNMSIVAMKVLGMGRYVNEIGVNRCFRYSMNLPVSTAIVGMKSKSELEQAISAVKNLSPLSDKEMADARGAARKYANTSVLWWKRT